jgi:methionyl-tRNA synthetase
VLTANSPETKDNDFTWKDFQARNNNELVAIYGNFVNRAIVLTHKYFDGKVPQRYQLQPVDEEVLASLEAFPEKIAQSLEKFRFREALALMMDFARMGNKYLADTEPWKTIKEDGQRAATVLNIALNITANLCILSEPFLPFTAGKLKDILQLDALRWAMAGNGEILRPGTPIDKAGLLFDKIEDKTVDTQVEKLLATKKLNEAANAPAVPAKELVQFEDFSKLDLRVVTILSAEKVKKSKKLLKLTVDTGLGKRIVLSGVAEQFTPDELVGKQVTMLINLSPKKMAGIDSEGMILMAEDRDGKYRLLQPNSPTEPGAPIS